jgi:FkbM family methyltransferase
MTLSTLKHWTKFALQPKYRGFYSFQQELERIKNTPRYTHLHTDLLGPNLNVIDGLSFYYSYKEIFEQEIYRFPNAKPSPIVIDGGANIGLSVIFFKQLYPDCKITAFEADPHVFQVLRSNLAEFDFRDIKLINQALWHTETILEFAVEGADGGRLAHAADQEQSKKINVNTIRLKSYLEQSVDFLKLDIEGAETEVILDCSDYLHNVKYLFIEYHSFYNEEQRLDELLHVLRQAKFRVQLQTQFGSPKPFLEHPTQLGMDLQLNLFAYRD